MHRYAAAWLAAGPASRVNEEHAVKTLWMSYGNAGRSAPGIVLRATVRDLSTPKPCPRADSVKRRATCLCNPVSPSLHDSTSTRPPKSAAGGESTHMPVKPDTQWSMALRKFICSGPTSLAASKARRSDAVRRVP
eukprot:4878550-Amphidinium_carterae.1